MRFAVLSALLTLSLSASAASVQLSDLGPVATVTADSAPLAVVVDGSPSAVAFTGQVKTAASSTYKSVAMKMTSAGLVVGSHGTLPMVSDGLAVIAQYNGGVDGLDSTITGIRFPTGGTVEAAHWSWTALECVLDLDDFGECDETCDDAGYAEAETDTEWVDGDCILVCTCYTAGGDLGEIILTVDTVLD